MDDRHPYSDKASGARNDRADLKSCFECMDGCWKLDRLDRFLPHLLAIVTDLEERDIAFRSLAEQMDTATPPVTAVSVLQCNCPV